MKKLIITSFIFCSTAALNAMHISLPEEAILERRLCNAGYRPLVEKTPLVRNLARKRLTVNTVYTEVEGAQKQLKDLPTETLQEHSPKITVIILQEFPEAIKHLAKTQPLSPKASSDLKARGFLSPELCEELKIVAF